MYIEPTSIYVSLELSFQDSPCKIPKRASWPEKPSCLMMTPSPLGIALHRAPFIVPLRSLLVCLLDKQPVIPWELNPYQWLDNPFLGEVVCISAPKNPLELFKTYISY